MYNKDVFIIINHGMYIVYINQSPFQSFSECLAIRIYKIILVACACMHEQCMWDIFTASNYKLQLGLQNQGYLYKLLLHLHES